MDRRHGEVHRRQKKNTDLHQGIPAQNPTPEVVTQGIQHYTLEMDQTITHRK